MSSGASPRHISLPQSPAKSLGSRSTLGDSFWGQLTASCCQHENASSSVTEDASTLLPRTEMTDFAHHGPLHIPHLEHRELRPSTGEHSGLKTGDVIVLKQQGRPCCVSVAHLLEPGFEPSAQYVLDLAGSQPSSLEDQHDSSSQGNGELAFEDKCLLEVVRQDSYLGFRSPVASWRYMQPRRKAPHRLIFFNLNLGIWEQWEVASGDPWTQPWSSIHLVLRSRRLPNITLDLQVIRVGKYGPSPIAHAAPTKSLASMPDGVTGASQSVGSSPGHATDGGSSHAGGTVSSSAAGARRVLQFSNELGEDEHLKRITALLVQEWVRFVDAEKTLRAELEDQMVVLVDEVAQLKMDTIGQVEFLRSQMNEEIIGLFDLAQMREFQLQQARAVRRRVLAVVVAAQWRRKASHTLQLVIEGWLQVRARNKRASDARGRKDHRTLAASFGAWGSVTAARAARARLLARGIMGTSRRVQQRTMDGWRDVTRSHVLGRHRLHTLATHREAAVLSDALQAWQQACLTQAQLWNTAELFHVNNKQRWLSRVLWGWWGVGRGKRVLRARGAVCTRRTTTRLTLAALLGWLAAVEEGQRLRAVGAAVKERSDARLQSAALAAWTQRVQHNAAVARKLAYHLEKVCRSRQARAMEGWRGLVFDARAAQAKLRKAHHTRGARLQAAALWGWAEVSAHKIGQQRRVARGLESRSHRLLSAAVCALWEQMCHTRTCRKAQRTRLHRHLLRAFQGWADVCALHAQGAAVLRSLARAREWIAWGAALREWAWLARWNTAQRAHAIARLPLDTQHSMALALGAWWQPCASSVSTHGGSIDVQAISSMGAAGTSSDVQAISSMGAAGTSSDSPSPQQWQQQQQQQLHASSLGQSHTTIASTSDSSTVLQSTGGVDSGAGAGSRAARMAWLTGVVLHAWWGAAAEHRERRGALDRHRRKVERQKLAAVLRGWEDAVCSTKWAREVALRWAQDSQTGLLTQVFLAWHYETRDSKAREQILARRAEHAKEAKLRAVLLAWSEVVEGMALTRQAAEERASEVQMGLMWEALQQWIAYAVHRKQLMVKAAYAVTRMSQLRLRMALISWEEGVAIKRTRAAKFARAVAWHSLRQQRAAFHALLHNVMDAHARQDAVVAFVMSTSSARMAAALSSWAALTQRAAVLRCRAASLARRRDARCLAMALVGWAGLWEEAKAARARAGKLQSVRNVRLQRAVLQEWASAAHCFKQGRQMLALWASDYLQSTLAYTWRLWLDAAKARKRTRRAVATVRERKKGRLRARVLSAWQSYSRECALTRQMVGQALRRKAVRCQWQCLRAWRSACAHAAWRAHVLVLSINRRYAVLCGNVLRAWEEAVVDNRVKRRGMERLCQRREARLLQQHLHTWCAVVAENRRRMDNLKACLKRKKVAFQLFKAWYWNAFDSDVQETIRRMFHTTSSTTPALPRPPLRPPQRTSLPGTLTTDALQQHQLQLLSQQQQQPQHQPHLHQQRPQQSQQQSQQLHQQTELQPRQQKTIAAAAAEAASRGGHAATAAAAAAAGAAGASQPRAPGATPAAAAPAAAAAAAAGQQHPPSLHASHGGSSIYAEKLLKGSIRARYGSEPGGLGEAGHAHSRKGGVLMSRPSQLGTPPQRSITSLLPASQPAPNAPQVKPDPGTPTKASPAALHSSTALSSRPNSAHAASPTPSASPSRGIAGSQRPSEGGDKHQSIVMQQAVPFQGSFTVSNEPQLPNLGSSLHSNDLFVAQQPQGTTTPGSVNSQAWHQQNAASNLKHSNGLFVAQQPQETTTPGSVNSQAWYQQNAGSNLKHSNGLFVAQHTPQGAATPDSVRSPEWGVSPVKPDGWSQRSGLGHVGMSLGQSMQYGRYNELFSDEEEEGDL